MADTLPPPLRGDSPPPAEDLVTADPERSLAVTYAPVAARAGLAALFALDEKLGGIVASTSEPMIGLMRLTWWRDQIMALGQGPAAAEPLLGHLAADVIARGAEPATIAAMEDGWAALLDGPMDAEAIARHGQARGGHLFVAAGAVLKAETDRLHAAGQGWALADLAHRHSDAEVRAEAARQARAALAPLAGTRWARAARPLGALAVLAARDAADPQPRRQASPGRLFRMLALRLTGR